MTAPYGYSDEELYESFEMFESDDSDDLDERSRPMRGRPRPVPVSGGRSAFRQPASRSYVTEAQLKAALERVGQQIRTNSGAIKTLEGRATSLASEQSRMGVALKKEGEARKKDVEAVRKELQETRELTMIAPILFKDNPMMGFLLASGLGGSGGSGGLLGGGLMTAVILSNLMKPPVTPAPK